MESWHKADREQRKYAEFVATSGAGIDDVTGSLRKSGDVIGVKAYTTPNSFFF
jgi:hypothetical protein